MPPGSFPDELNHEDAQTLTELAAEKAVPGRASRLAPCPARV